jgi:hypothetical protein
MKIHFIIPGFSKCGTTSLCALLNQHPSIFIPIVEADFFGAEHYEQHWPKYEALFKNATAGQIIGENSARYSETNSEQLAARQIKEQFPNTKLIFIARDPVSRIESSYREMHHRGPEYGVDIPFNLYQAMIDYPAIIDDAIYWRKINVYRQHFADEQIHVMFLEDIKNDQKGCLSRCLDFLGLSPNGITAELDQQLNSANEKLIDTRILRWLRQNRWSGPSISRIPVTRQNNIFLRYGLRRRFSLSVQWSLKEQQLAHDKLFDDANIFLQQYKKPANFWPRLQALKAG